MPHMGKMRSLEEGLSGEVATGLPSKKQKVFPTIHLTESQVPELKGKELGGKCLLMIEASVTNIDIKTGYRLDMRKVAYYGKPGDIEKEKA